MGKKIRKAKMTIDVTEDVGEAANKVRAILLEEGIKTTYSEIFLTAIEVAGIEKIAQEIEEK
jgi:hypothetical protein